MSTADRRGMLDRDDPNLSVRAQCAMLGLFARGSIGSGRRTTMMIWR